MFLVNIGSWRIKKLQILICLRLFIPVSGVYHKSTEQALAVALPFLLPQTWEMWAGSGEMLCVHFWRSEDPRMHPCSSPHQL